MSLDERAPLVRTPPPCLYLRVDVCTFRGLRDGVPRVLASLRRADARATFFVTMGPDASGLALRKLLHPAFALKVLRTRAVSSYGLATALYGTLLPAPLVGAGLPDHLRRIRDEGHEVGAHGWDHRRWQDGMPRFPRSRLAGEFEQMVDAFRRGLDAPPRAFAAPAWMLTPDLLALEEEAGLEYASDARGARPFLPRLGGRDYTVPQVPVSLPTLDERIGIVGRRRFVAETIEQVGSSPGYACYAAHAETEGGRWQPELEEILRGCGRRAVPLREARREDLPRAAVEMRPLPGRPYPVAQADAKELATGAC